MSEYNIRNNANYSVQDLYSKQLPLSQGIEFEYERYTNCCFMEIYLSYNAIEVIMMRGNEDGTDRNHTLIHLWNVRNEDFVNDFNRTCNILLDKIGVMNAEDRNDFMTQFQTFDRKQHPNLRRGRKHITQGKFNKTQQIEILLNDPIRCNVLKNQTILLDYEWMHSAFC